MGKFPNLDTLDSKLTMLLCVYEEIHHSTEVVDFLLLLLEKLFLKK